MLRGDLPGCPSGALMPTKGPAFTVPNFESLGSKERARGTPNRGKQIKNAALVQAQSADDEAG